MMSWGEEFRSMSVVGIGLPGRGVGLEERRKLGKRGSGGHDKLGSEIVKTSSACEENVEKNKSQR